MANNENLIPIPGRLHSVATEGHVAGADEIYDDTQSKLQSAINADVAEDISDLQEIVGEGSVDTRIENAIKALDAEKSQTAGADGLALSVTEVDGKITSISGSIATDTYDSYGSASAAQEAAATDATTKVNAAKEALLGDAATDYNTLGKLEDAIQSEASTRETEIGTDSTAGSVKGRIKSLETLVGSTDVDSQIDAKINALDSTKSQTAGADGLALSIEEEDGKIKSISGSIAANTYDAYGAASTAKSDLLGDAASDYNTLGKLEDAIQAEVTTRSGETEALDGRLDNIEDVIPSAASSSNQLADKSFVNSSISTATAEFQGSYNSVSDLELTTSATHAQIATALGTEISGADNNDYCFVQIPTADATPTDIAKVERYKYNGTAWSFEYELNNSGYTDAQWAAINSGITTNLVTAFGNKYDKPSTGIPSTDMTSDVQTSLGKADSAYQKPSGGIPDSDLTSDVQTSLSKADTAYQKPSGGIPASDLADGVIPDISGKANKSEMSVVDGTGADADKTTITLKDGTSATVLKSHQDISGKQDVIDSTHKLAADLVDDTNSTNKFTNATEKQTWNAKQDALTFNTTPSADNKVATMADIEDATENCAYLGEDDSSAVIADFDPQTDTVWKKAQILSDADKAQVKANLGLPQEIYSKTEVNGLITTPNQQYVTVATYASLPATGSADTVYRVSNYNGSTNQVDATMYSEYAWNGSDYTFLCVKSQIGEIFDITAYNSNTKYADLSAALGTNGANVPEGVRKGGMSVKYVSNSDNTYVQYMCKSSTWSSTPTDWEKVNNVTVSQNTLSIGGEEKGVFPQTFIVKGIGRSDSGLTVNVGECYINVTRSDCLRQKTAEPNTYVSVVPNKEDIIVFEGNQFKSNDDGVTYNILGFNKKKIDIDDILFSHNSISLPSGNVKNAGNNRLLSEEIIGQNIKIVLNSGYYGFLYIYDLNGKLITCDETSAKSSFEVTYPALLKYRFSVRKSDNTDIETAKEAINSIEGFYLNENRNHIYLRNLIADNTESNKFSALFNSSISDSEINLIEITISNNDIGSAGVQYQFASFGIDNHKYYLGCDVYPDRDGYVLIRNIKTFIKGGQWNKVSVYADLNELNSLAFRYSTQGVVFSGDKVKFRNFRVFDVTESFSAVQTPSKTFVDNIIGNYSIEADKVYDISVDGIITEHTKKIKIYGNNVVCKGDGIQCTGIADQEVINSVISDLSINEIEFAVGSEFNITSAIKVRRDNLTIKGNNAKFLMANVVEIKLDNFRQASNNIDWILVCDATDYENNIEKLVDGVYVEVYNDDATQNDHTSHCSGYIIKVNESISGKQLRLGKNTEDTADAQTPATYIFKTGAKMRTVPSIWDVQGVENVIVDSVYCDLNLTNNPRSNDTFIAQNGLHFYNCENCEIKNSTLNNGGRHGILLSSSKNCKIFNCNLDTWREHCIDVASHTSDTFDMFNVVSGCTLKNPALAGIQMHKGSRNIITDNFIVGGSWGISTQESAYYNNICNNTIIDSVDGIYLRAGAKGTVIIGNIIKIENDEQVSQVSGIHLTSALDCLVLNNNIYGYRVGIEFETCSQCKIDGNMVQKSKTNGIRVTINSERCIVENNTSIDECQETWVDRHYFVQINNSSDIIVKGNSIYNTVSDRASYAGIGETGELTSVERNIFVNNVVNGLLTAVSTIASTSINSDNYVLN